MLNYMKAQDEQIKLMAETLKTIKDAMGVDTIVGENNTLAYKEQADNLTAAILTSE